MNNKGIAAILNNDNNFLMHFSFLFFDASSHNNGDVSVAMLDVFAAFNIWEDSYLTVTVVQKVEASKLVKLDWLGLLLMLVISAPAEFIDSYCNHKVPTCKHRSTSKFL